MVRQFTIDESSWLLYAGFVFCAALGMFAARWTIAVFRATRLFHTASGQVLTQSDRSKIAVGCGLALLWRGLLAASSFGVAWMFYLNAFAWFRGVDITDGKARFHFCWPRPSVEVSLQEVRQIEARTRNNRTHLVLKPGTRRALRSIATDQSYVIAEIKQALVDSR